MSDGLDFQLDIESRLRGGDAVTELEQLESRFTDLQTRYGEFQKAAESVNAALEKNAKALDDTRSAMGRAMQEGNEKKFWALAQKVQTLEAEETKLKTKADAATQAMARQAKTLTHAADKVGALKKQEEARTKLSEIATRRTEQFNGRIGTMIKSVSAAADDIGEMGSALGTVGTLAALGASAIVVLIAAVVAGAIAFGAGAIALDKYAVGLANVKRNQEQTLRAMTQNNAVAKEMNGSIEEISAATGIGSDQLLGWTKQLTVDRQMMGQAALKGNELKASLYAAATAAQALGDSSTADTLVGQLKDGAITADRLASTVDRKYGNVLKQKMLGLDQQLFTLHKNIAGIFGGLNIEPFLRGLSRVVALFDVSTASGKAIKSIFDSIFGPTTGDIADKFFIGLERLILNLEIDVLDLQRFFQNLAATWEDLMGRLDATPLKPIKDAFQDLLKPLGQADFYIKSFFDLLTSLVSPIHALERLVEVITKIETGLMSLTKKAAGAAADFVLGLVNGITAGGVAVEKAVQALGQTAIDGLKHALDSHSPSRKFFAIGLTAPQGMAAGVEAGSDRVGAAIDDMVSMPREAAPSSSTSTSSRTVTVGPIHIEINGTPSDDDLGQLEDRLLAIFDRAGERMAAEAPANAGA